MKQESTNNLFVRGRLGSDFKLEETKSGEVYGRASVATSEKFKNVNGVEFQSKPTWHDVKIWGKGPAEEAQKNYQKGAYVEVSGPIQPSSYESQNGERVYTYALNAAHISKADANLPSENKLSLAGRVQEDIAVRQSPEGKSYVNLSLRTAEDYFDRDGVKHERGAFHRIHTSDSNQIENIQAFKKGDLLEVDGKIEKRSFMTQKGKTHSFSIIPSSIELSMKPELNPEKKSIEVRKGQPTTSPLIEEANQPQPFNQQPAKRPGRPKKDQEPAINVPF